MNYTTLFYWLTVADNAKTMFVWFIIIFMIIALISTIAYFVTSNTEGQGQTKDDEKNQKMARKWMWWSYPFMILFWSLYIFTPNKRDALLIVAGGQTLNYLTTDSVTKQIPRELSNFVITELKNMAAEAQVNLNIQSQKEKIMEEAQAMTAGQIIEKIRVDSVFAKIILNK